MSIEAIAALSTATTVPNATAAATLASTPPIQWTPAATQLESQGFDSIVTNLQSLSAEMQSNSQAVQALATGDAEGLHRVIMNLESTRLKFDLALQVRNKILDAYQELMRMQI